MHFELGDFVVAIEDFEYDNRQFYKGDVGTVVDVRNHWTEIAIKWERPDEDWLGSATWFVPTVHLALQSESSILSSPYANVIRKIKRLQDKRKDLGYAF